MNKEFIGYKKAIDSLHRDTEFIKFKKAFTNFKKIILLGNGGSNSITSHISQDYVKFCGKKAFSMSDPSMLTCFANDFGVKNIFVRYLQYFSDKDTLVIIISSSGESQNIINAIKFCEKNNLSYGILTGFNPNNKAVKISKNALWSYNIPITNYGVVECVHQIFLHGVV